MKKWPDSQATIKLSIHSQSLLCSIRSSAIREIQLITVIGWESKVLGCESGHFFMYLWWISTLATQQSIFSVRLAWLTPRIFKSNQFLKQWQYWSLVSASALIELISVRGLSLFSSSFTVLMIDHYLSFFCNWIRRLAYVWF